MEWTSLNDLREKYLSFFESKGHLRLNSFPLVPQNDNSLLLINSGMAPMKKFFTGEITPPSKRVTTCQKCIRTPDLERVGITARHGTYFEMLGNFSFGDYFKIEAIKWSWEFLTETLAIPTDLLWPSVYEEDDEAYAIWRDVIGVPEAHIVKMGKADNFWEHGTGPCGPCSEIYFDRGEKYGCGSADCKPGCDCDRYMEIWNNVFSQFNNMGDGTYTELENKNIDTGMGLERLACVMQGVDNMFEVDTIRKILNKVCEISGKEYGKDSATDVSIRAITDHARASTFMISDGIIPSNEGRGYVLRRIIRRAVRHGKLIGIDRPFFMEICNEVIGENKAGYPELVEKKELITKVINNEEAGFNKTIDQGLSMLNELTKDGKDLSGENAFKLYDTYGFPIDLIKDILAEKGIGVDEDGFKKLMDEQRKRARDARSSADTNAWKGSGADLSDLSATKFLGYEIDECAASVVALLAADGRTEKIEEGEKGAIVLDCTTFYAESGGQIADTGAIVCSNAVFRVENVTKNGAGVFVHSGYVECGCISLGDSACASIDSERREDIRRNHTAAHLLQAALRSVLGNHVEQAGQLVDESGLRFDFTHFSALTSEELEKVEAIINIQILAGTDVDSREMPIEEARKLGAMALFGEKYGDVVRVVRAGDNSIEFCGGTHISNTAKLGLFRIISEGSVAAGVRRIEAVTGFGVIRSMKEDRKMLEETAAVIKCGNVIDVPSKVRQLNTELKDKTNTIAKLESELAGGKLNDLTANAKDLGEIKLITSLLKGAASDELKLMGEQLKAGADTIAVLAGVNGDKLTFMCACGADAVKNGAHAGNIVREIAKLAGGNGGGRPDIAMAGGKDIAKAEEALSAAEGIISDFIK